ncbi:hypothetical protein [Flavobacterium ustbae]|uniref:hypothetical protein n=1 Tax=Flavobacterium ustbae TaxID=2488790 RepID=UPI000F7AAB33|nr:hypothetical protein [Flavobacterium ustbae]
MKKILLLIVISLTVISCTQQSKLEKFIEKTVKNKLNDPESFELVSLKTENKDVVNILFEKNKEEVVNRKKNYEKYGDSESASKYALAKKIEDNVRQVNNGTMVYATYTYRVKNATGNIITETKFSFIALNKI